MTRRLTLSEAHRQRISEGVRRNLKSKGITSASDKQRIDLARKVLEVAETRRQYFATRGPHNGWSGNESGPCCERCTLRSEHLTGRADALKVAAGCRNPFQLPEVCQCHLQTRQAVTAGIDKALTQVLTVLRELFVKEGIDVSKE